MSAPLPFRGEYARRSLPLLLALVGIVSTAAPTAYYAVSVRELRARGRSIAERLGVALSHEAVQRPLLWRYDSEKVAMHLTAAQGIDALRVYDDRGAVVAERGEVPLAAVWESAPIPEAGRVWLAMSVAPPRRLAGTLLAVFFVLGSVLAGALAWLSDRALRQAGGRIGALIAELEALNADLERQVEARVAQLEERDRRLRELTTRAVAMQEAERRAIGRELHDGAGQVLTAIRINLQILSQAVRGQGGEERAERSLALVDDAIEEVRHALELLGPPIVAEVGLVEALRRLCEGIDRTAGLHVALDVGAMPPLEPAVEVTVYRVTQEALTNVVRHAGATQAQVSVRRHEGRLVVTVRDDGIGITSGEGGGRGLDGMRARAELLGGHAHVSSGDSGTEIRVELPLPAEAHDSGSAS